MILTEMVHDARIVRIGERRTCRQHIRPWMGDSIGRWEGDTLVVETTNFHPQQNFRGASDNLKSSSASRASTPTRIALPVHGRRPDDVHGRRGAARCRSERLDELIYEYACHEGNYALANVLSGARAQEKRDARPRSRRSSEETEPMRSDTSANHRGGAVCRRTVPVAGHHAFGAEFDPNAPIRLQGKVVKLEWVNPHAWIHIEVVKRTASPEVWMVEGGTPNTLLRRGLTRDSLTVGTEIIVDGYQTKDHSLKRANGRDVTFTDGRKMFMGSSGTGAPRDGRDPDRRQRRRRRSSPAGDNPGMTSRRASLALVVCLAAAAAARCGGESSAPAPAASAPMAFSAFVDEFLEQFAADEPVDRRRQRPAPARRHARGLQRRRHSRAEIATWRRLRASLQAIPVDGLTPDERVDHRIIGGLHRRLAAGPRHGQELAEEPDGLRLGGVDGVHNLMTMESSPAERAGAPHHRQAGRGAGAAGRRRRQPHQSAAGDGRARRAHVPRRLGDAARRPAAGLRRTAGRRR